MRLIYPFLALALALACENESSHQQPDTSAETASEAPESTTGSGEPVLPTSTGPTEGAEPNNADMTTGELGTTEFTGTGAEDPEETVGSSTTLFEGSTGDTTDGSAAESESDTEPPPAEETTGEDPQPCVGAAGPVKAKVIAYLESQIGEGDTDGEPGRIYLRFSNQSFTCADPHDALACSHNWEVSLQIPVEFQVPGVYSLADGPILAIAGSSAGGDDVCEKADGAVSGTLEIDAVEEGSVIGRLCHLRAYGIEGQILLDGTFEAPRCSQ